MRSCLLVVVLLVAGCSGMGYALNNYSGVEVQTITGNGQSLRVFDKPEEGRMMITPHIGKAYAQGATLGLASTAEGSYKQAALAFLQSTGRNCTVGEMMLVVQPQWETCYTCE